MEKREFLTELSTKYKNLLGFELNRRWNSENAFGYTARILTSITAIAFYLKTLYYIGLRINLSYKRVNSSFIEIDETFNYFIVAICIMIVIGILFSLEVYKIYLIKDNTKKARRAQKRRKFLLYLVEIVSMSVFLLFFSHISIKTLWLSSPITKIMYLILVLGVGWMTAMFINCIGAEIAKNHNRKISNDVVEDSEEEDYWFITRRHYLVSVIIISVFIISIPLIMDLATREERIITEDAAKSDDKYVFINKGEDKNTYCILYENKSFYVTGIVYYDAETDEVKINYDYQKVYEKGGTSVQTLSELRILRQFAKLVTNN